MPEPRKHHYLPQFYLRYFSEDEQSIWQIVKVKRTEDQPLLYKSAISDTAVVRDYHKLDYDSAVDSNAVEKELARVESLLAVALSKALESGVQNSQIRELLVFLVSLLMFRVPRYKTFIENSLRENVRTTGLMMERKGELPEVPAGREEALSFENLRISIHNWICLSHMFQLAFDPKILGLLNSMHLSLWHTDATVELLTSDNPVSIFRPDAKRGDSYGTGIADRRVQISVPITSHALLFLSWNHEATSESTLNDSLVHEYNRRTIVSADKVVFASSNKDGLIRMVEEFRHCSTHIQIENADCGDEFIHLMRQWPVMPPEEYPRTGE